MFVGKPDRRNHGEPGGNRAERSDDVPKPVNCEYARTRCRHAPDVADHHCPDHHPAHHGGANATRNREKWLDTRAQKYRDDNRHECDRGTD
jgi:hypothetical protein